ncbi:spinster family MFS transporter [Brevundimonas sp.]
MSESVDTGAAHSRADLKPWASPALGWWAVTILTLAYTVSFVDRTIISLLIDPIKADLSLSDTEISLLQGLAFGIFYAVMGVPLGWAADRVPRRSLIAAGIAFWCIATAMCGLARNFWQLFLARMGVGVGEAALSPAALSLISDLFPPEKRALPIAVYSAASAVGAGLALVIGGAVIALVATAETIALPVFGELRPWQAAFVMVGLPGLILAVLMFTIHEPGRRGLDASKAAVAETGIAEQPFVARLKSERGFYLPHYAACAIYTALVYGVLSWAPAFFMRKYGMTPAEVGLQYGLVVLVFAGAGPIVGGLIAGKLSRGGMKLANFRVAVAGMILTAPLLLAAVAMPSAGLSLAVFSVALVSFSLPGGVVLAALQDATPAALRGRASATYYLVVSVIGLSVGPISVALLTDRLFGDPAAVGWSIAVVGLIAAPVSAFLMHLGSRSYLKTLPA